MVWQFWYWIVLRWNNFEFHYNRIIWIIHVLNIIKVNRHSSIYTRMLKFLYNQVLLWYFIFYFYTSVSMKKEPFWTRWTLTLSCTLQKQPITCFKLPQLTPIAIMIKKYFKNRHSIAFLSSDRNLISWVTNSQQKDRLILAYFSLLVSPLAFSLVRLHWKFKMY